MREVGFPFWAGWGGEGSGDGDGVRGYAMDVLSRGLKS